LFSLPGIPISARGGRNHYDHRVWVRLRFCAPALASRPDCSDRRTRDPPRQRACDSFTGVRFALDALIGLVPAVGDIVTATLSLFIVHEAYQLGVPGHIILRMLGNVVVDGALGAVPVVGDVFDVLWRANRRNVRLLREWLEREEWRS
jgi:Domain of unknown function (DUF4112)